MASDSTVIRPPVAESIGRGTGLFVRQSSGLVRVGSFLDVLLYNVGTFSPFLTVAIGVFWVASAWPGANIPLALIGALILGLPVWTTFALLSAAMPRTAAQYVTVSRILNPAVGFMADFGFTISSIISIGLGASWVATVALAPMLVNAGILTNNQGLQNLGSAINGRWGIVIIGAISTIIVGIVLILGTRLAFRVLRWAYVVGFVGMLPFLWVMITTTHQQFVSQFNAFAGGMTKSSNAYQAVIDSATKQGLTYQGNDVGQTLLAMAVPFGLFAWAYWSSTIAGEMRGAGSARRQIGTMVGGGVILAVWLLALVLLSLNLFGVQFLTSAVFLSTAANNPLAGVTPYIYFFAGVLQQNVVLLVLVAIGLVAWLYPNLLTNFGQATRSLFAYSLDRVMPNRLADVNDRTHSPVVTIGICTVLGISGAVWVALSSSFLTVVAFVQEMAMAQVFLIGLTGLLFPYLKRDIFTRSQADIRVAGIPLVSIAGAGCMIASAFYIIDTLSHPSFFSLTYWWQGALGTLVPWVTALVIFGVATVIRRREGFKLSATYNAIPPE
ncbi:MAG TPA: amino acid permease [Candidatus Dormibacteraeota bacterium]